LGRGVENSVKIVEKVPDCAQVINNDQNQKARSFYWELNGDGERVVAGICGILRGLVIE
jgi:hypothetical protein